MAPEPTPSICKGTAQAMDQGSNPAMVTTEFATQIPQVLKALEEGSLSMEVIDRAAARVLGWKYDLGLLT